MEKFVTVIGGLNLDIKGIPGKPLLNGTSNPGDVYTSAGGVGRNIAHNLALLGVPVYLLGAVGDDRFGRQILDDTREAGVRLEYVRMLAGQRTGVYLAVLDHERDLTLGISDMAILHAVDIPYLEQCRDLIRQSQFVVLETNLEPDALAYAVELCRGAQVPYLIEPVSVEKAQKIRQIQGILESITPNLAEFAALVGQPPEGLQDLAPSCAALGTRFQHLFITLGAEGVYHYSSRDAAGQYYPSLPTTVVDANGAGDAFVAGLVSGMFSHLPLERCVRLGMAAAYQTLLSKETVRSDLSFQLCCSLQRYSYALNAPCQGFFS